MPTVDTLPASDNANLSTVGFTRRVADNLLPSLNATVLADRYLQVHQGMAACEEGGLAILGAQFRGRPTVRSNHEQSGASIDRRGVLST